MKTKQDEDFSEYSPTLELTDKNFIINGIWECLKNNDPDGIMEIMKAHLEAVNKLKKRENLNN